MADIGCDHGFLPLYLLENDICPKAIMCDVSKGSLAKAKTNFDLLGKDLNCEFRLGDGLAVLETGEVDNVVIAGMGGILMSEIIDADLEKSYAVGKFILQPRNKPGYLRKFLYDNDFAIIDEKIVEEGKFLCEIIIAAPHSKNLELNFFPEKVNSDDLETYFDFPEYLISLDNPLWIKYLRRHREINEKIYQKIDGTRDSASIYNTKKRIDRINYLLAKKAK